MKKHVPLIFLLIISLLPLVDLTHPGLPVTHDGQDHVARIANFYQSLTEGNSIPRWAGNLNWGYGHPILMFLYPLPSYITSLFHFIGFSFIDSTKLIFAITFVASMFTMYLWVRDQFGRRAGYVAAILYGLAPYRFVDLYVRGAIGEHVAFIFLPLILWSLNRRRTIIGAISLAGLMLSHNAVSLMFAPVIVLYVLYLNRSYLYSLAIVVVGLLLSAFFWIPAFFEGKYTLRDIVTNQDFSNRFVQFSQLLYSPWNYGIGNELSKEIGIVGLVIIAVALFLLFKLKDKRFIGGVLSILGACIFLMLRVSQGVWQSITILQKFQFPWRFLHLVVFCVAVLAGFVMSKIPFKHQKHVAIIITVAAMITTYSMWHAQTYRLYPDDFYKGVYNGTTDTGESSPIWSVRFMESRPKNVSEVIGGSASILPTSRTSTKHSYRVIAFTRSQIVENTLYFPGWSVYVDGIPVPVEYQDQNHRGLMTYWTEAGTHTIDIVFQNTKVRLLASAISMATFVVFVVYMIMPLWKKRNA